jgi:hypothetical protein
MWSLIVVIVCGLLEGKRIGADCFIVCVYIAVGDTVIKRG